jgi:hypothetical protein
VVKRSSSPRTAAEFAVDALRFGCQATTFDRHLRLDLAERFLAQGGVGCDPFDLLDHEVLDLDRRD